MLILVPTAIESAILFPNGSPGRIALCGFGLAAAGAGAAHAIAVNRSAASDGVVLVGAAGTYDAERHPVGSAVVAGRIRCDGIGAGAGAAHRSAAELGFAESDAIDLGDDVELLSVAAAAGSPQEAADRRSRHPTRPARRWRATPSRSPPSSSASGCTIVRGFSNVAGERDRSRWRMQEALERAAGARAGGGRMKLRLGLSTCPNDTFAFHAILERRIDLRGLEFEADLLDVQQLNDGLFAGRYDISKASFYAALLLAGDYGVLRAGSALGFGVGPLHRGRPAGRPARDGRARALPRRDDDGDPALPLPAPAARARSTTRCSRTSARRCAAAMPTSAC